MKRKKKRLSWAKHIYLIIIGQRVINMKTLKEKTNFQMKYLQLFIIEDSLNNKNLFFKIYNPN